ncbi:hypothetical protein IKF03_02140 [Candidatus Saccharibacteria bacterium]|nr:hypothetical protein [Candidatus Saccharibacteria bacterium]
MAQAKKKQATKTAKKGTRAKAGTAKKRTCCAKKACQNNHDRNHIYVVTVMGMITAILLCANAAMLMV